MADPDGPVVDRRTPGAGSGWAWFLDFDGTLVDIAERPDAVVVDPGLPGLLLELRTACDGALAIVTGRSVGVIEGFLPSLGLDICGLHGLERRLAGRLARIELGDAPAFRSALQAVLADLPAIEGALVEDKGDSVAFHWRRAPDASAVLTDAAARIVAAVPGYRLQHGKAVVEVVPVAAGKGAAVEALLALPSYRGRRPVFAGDDVTDENGFAAVNARGGVSIKIGEGDTLATRRIATPTLFRDLLAQVASGLSPIFGETSR